MNDAQKQRFWELQSKKSHTASQRDELAALEALAVKSGLDLETLKPSVEQSSLTENELIEIVKSAVEDQVFGLREEIIDEVKKAAGAEQIEEIVKKHAPEVDFDALVEKFEKANSRKEENEALVESLKSVFSDFRGESKMNHQVQEEAPLIEMPYGDSKENLTVAQKQLHNLLMGKHQDQDIPESSLKIAQDRGNSRLSRIEQKALATQGGPTGTTGTGAGVELTRVNVDLSSQLQELLYAESALANRMIGSEINMPTNPFKLPVVTSRPDFKLQNEASNSFASTTNTAQDIGTSNVTLDTFKLVGISEYSYEVDEDSILAILPIITNQLASGAAASFENAIINGDSATTHRDSGTAANSAAKACDGLRKLANAGNLEKSLGAALSSEGIGALRAMMGVYGLNPNDLAIIVNIADYNTLLMQDEVAYANTFGQDLATLRTGTLPKIFGIDIVPSAQMPSGSADDNGVVSGVATDDTKSVCALIHVPSFTVGVRRGFTVETDKNMVTQVNQVIASFRRDFQPIGTPSSANFSTVVTGINIT